MTYNKRLLAIVGVFKSLYHYLKVFKYKVLILIDNNNLQNLYSKIFNFCQIDYIKNSLNTTFISNII